MSILNRNRPAVKSARPTDPAVPAWEAAARETLTGLGYAPLDADAAVSWFRHRSTFRACPAIAPRDALSLDAEAAEAERAELEAEADRQTGGGVEGPADSWASWTDAFRFEPTAEDRIWHCLDGERRAAPAPARRRTIHPNNRIDALAAGSLAVDAHERGLVAPDVAETILGTSLIGHQP